MKTAGHAIWPALVLTAGFGTRLRPLSYVRAKPAMPVAGEPLVRRILAWLASHGTRDVVLNLHYKPQTITAVVGDGSDLGLRVSYSFEDPILGSAGGPRQALPMIDSPRFFIVNGDTLTDVELGALAESHEASGALVTMALVVQPDPGHYGGVSLDAEGAVTGFVKRGTPSTYHFVGVQAVSAAAFANVAPGQPAETVGALYPHLLAERPGCVRGFVCDATFHDVGTPHDYLLTSLRLARQEGRAVPLVGRNCAIDDAAAVQDSVLWDDVVVEAGAALDRCIVADGVRVPAGARFEEAALVRRPAGYAPLFGEEIAGSLLVRRL
jgi:NDP-sugar pyrophosphorylase family protein